jgi:tight adherence protein B
MRPILSILVVALISASAWMAVPARPDVRVGSVAQGEPGCEAPSRVRRLATWLVGPVGFGPASRRLGARERIRAVQAIGALAAELEVGQPPRQALEGSGGAPSIWPAALAAAQMGGDVASGLVLDSRHHPVLHQLAACWQVAAESGAGLAAAVGRLATAARAAEDVRVDLEAQLAGPRATARMLAALPVVGVGFGLMLGSDPLAWLVGSPPGRACLLGGVVLTATGTWWTGRIAARVERLL